MQVHTDWPSLGLSLSGRADATHLGVAGIASVLVAGAALFCCCGLLCGLVFLCALQQQQKRRYASYTVVNQAPM